MLTRFVVVVCLLLALLGLTSCVWAISAHREALAVGLGSAGLVLFVTVWLITLPSALQQT